METRKSELFLKRYTKELDCIANVPRQLYKQERDWTCSIACIRTLLSSIEDVKSEDWFIGTYKLTPGPHYSKDIRHKGILVDYDVKYGCEYDNINFESLIELCKMGYYIMVESMINFSHWLVLLGYFTLKAKNDMEDNIILLYDPYYDELKQVRAEEFIEMWVDGDYINSKVKNDFIAIKGC